MMKKGLLILCTALFFFQMTSAQKIDSAHRADWFKEAKFGMFVHFGLYSILAGSYDGHTLPDTTFPHGNSWYAEWIEQRLEVPDSVYHGLVKRFNPIHFDADKWIRQAADAGMKYFVITAKHHDGFALWDSKVSDYDIASTPYQGDLLGDLAKACRKYGVKFGFYYSHCEDWYAPGGAKPHWKPRVSQAAFTKYWNRKVIPQIKELIHRYDPDLFWFDTWGDAQEKEFITDKRRDQLIALIRKLDPKCLINGRISFLNPGDEVDYLSMLDNAYPGQKKSKPWQTPATMVNSWGWHAKDYHWKTTQEMISNLLNNTSKGGNYLLNVGPKPDGTFPKMAIRRLREMSAWMETDSEAVFGTRPVDTDAPDGTVFTQKTTGNGQKNIYVSLVRKQKKTLRLPFDYDRIKRCTLLEDGMPISYKENNEGKTILDLPDKVANLYDGVQVIKLEISPAPDWEDDFNQNGHFDTTKWAKIPRGKSDWNRHMSSDNRLFQLKDGKLLLWGRKNNNRAKDTARWITGGLFTRGKKAFGYGRLVIRAKFEDATGAWPAFWMLPTDAHWPNGGEIDIMERLNDDSIAYQTVHSPYTLKLGIKDHPLSHVTAPIDPDGFNTYAVDRYPDSLVFYVNGRKTFSYPKIDTDKQGQFPFDKHKFYLLIDMQLGGNWVGKVDPADLPVKMEIDWVRFYKLERME